MLKSIALAAMCAGLVLCGCALMESFYGPIAEAGAREVAGSGWMKGELHQLLFRLSSHQEKQPTPAFSFDEWLPRLLVSPLMEKLAPLCLFLLTSTTSFLFVLELRRTLKKNPIKEKHSEVSSDADAATLEEKSWGGVLCCHFTPHAIREHSSDDVNGANVYTVIVKGLARCGTYAQLKVTIQTKKTMTEDNLRGLEEAILDTLNHPSEDASSHQRFLEIVYDSAMKYLREHDFLDDTPERAEEGA